MTHEVGNAVQISLVLPGIVKTQRAKEVGMGKAKMGVDVDEFTSSLVSNLKTGENYGNIKHWFTNLAFSFLPYSMMKYTKGWIVRILTS